MFVLRGRRQVVRIGSVVGASIACLGLSFTVGCGSDSGQMPVVTPPAGRPLWESRGITSYRYVLQIQAFSPDVAGGPLIITVNSGVPTVVGLPVIGGGGNVAAYDTIPELFDQINAARQQGRTVVAEYDPTYGYPTSIQIDADQLPSDGGMIITVSEFQKL